MAAIYYQVQFLYRVYIKYLYFIPVCMYYMPYIRLYLV
nr:MAG TPA: hypothetical protein [Caudoviricetes sp.]